MSCPECGTIYPKHDTRKKRTWRHLDTMQFSTYLHCEVSRIRCETHGAKTTNIPWAGKNSRLPCCLKPSPFGFSGQRVALKRPANCLV